MTRRLVTAAVMLVGWAAMWFALGVTEFCFALWTAWRAWRII